MTRWCPISVLPGRARSLIALNPPVAPIAAISVCRRAPDFLSRVYPASLGCGFPIFGYRRFKANEDRFADMV